MLSDILKSIHAQLYERAVSPLIGSFVLSWLIINYKFIMLLFSEFTLNEKYWAIDYWLYPDWMSVILFNVIYPLIAASFYIFVYPFFAQYAFEYSRKQHLKLINKKKEIDGQRLMDIDDSRALINKHYEMRREFESELDDRDSEITVLKSKLKENENLKESKKSHLSTLDSNENTMDIDSIHVSSNNIPSEQIDMLLKISKGDNISERFLVDNFSGTPARSKYILGELEEKGYVSRNKFANGEWAYSLRHKGRSLLAKKDLI